MGKNLMTPKAIARLKTAVGKPNNGGDSLKKFITRAEKAIVRNSKSGKTSK